MLWFSMALLVLGLFGAAVVRRHLHEAKLLRLREISHKERMAAMERNLPVSEGETSRVDSLLTQGHGAPAGPNRMTSASVHWVRLAALAVGLTCLFGGLGMVPGLYYQADAEASGLWPLGLMPIFTGIGLMVFFRLSRGLAQKMNGK